MVITRIVLPLKTWQLMRRHVGRCAPFEACGMLAGRFGKNGEGRVRFSLGVPNAERSPVRFRMEPHAQWRAFQRIEALRLDLLAIYHSHPRGPGRPSATDIAQNMYPVAQVICFREGTRWQARAFILERGSAVEIPLEFSRSE